MNTENNKELENETPVEIVEETTSGANDSADRADRTETASSAKSGEYTMGMLCHLLSFVGIIGVPIGNIIGPLVLWLVKKDEDAFVNATGKQVLNFQISMTIYIAICFALTLVFIGIFLIPIVIIVNIIYTIIAAIKANEGQVYQYPFTIQFIK